MAQAIPYLGFDGNCAEAIQFYERTLGLNVKLAMMMRGGDTPMAAEIPKEHAHRVVHARLMFGDGSMIYAGDTPAGAPYEGMKGIMITLNYPTASEAQKVFNALADGGRVTMPANPTFWAKLCGMVVDKFGTPWIVNGELLA